MSQSGSDDDESLVDITQWAPRQNTRPSKPVAPAIAAQRTESPEIELIESDAASELEQESDSATESDVSVIKVGRAVVEQVRVIIDVDPNLDPNDYIDTSPGAVVIRRVLKEVEDGDDVLYTVEFADMHRENVSQLHIFIPCHYVSSFLSIFAGSAQLPAQMHIYPTLTYIYIFTCSLRGHHLNFISSFRYLQHPHKDGLFILAQLHITSCTSPVVIAHSLRYPCQIACIRQEATSHLSYTYLP